MKTSFARTLARTGLALGLAVALGACNAASRMAEIGRGPALSKIDDPTAQKDYQAVALPMPRPEPVSHQANSLWRPGSRQFFKDQRAARIGDILTINVAIADKAKVSNSTTRSRDNSENADVSNFLGVESATNGAGTRTRSPLDKLFPGIDASAAVNLGSTSNATGKGNIQRDESINVKVAAIVTQVLPNGNMVIQGRQEVRVNQELRELVVSGVVRPADITSVNTINHTQIAEARISYGGRGVISDIQQPRYGQQLYDIIFPF